MKIYDKVEFVNKYRKTRRMSIFFFDFIFKSGIICARKKKAERMQHAIKLCRTILVGSFFYVFFCAHEVNIW